jgi:predicted nucleic acid-binding protein
MICFDTSILIWGVQGHARTGQEEMIDRTRRYIAFLREQNEQILVPTPALAEYLQGFDNEDRKAQLAILERSFVIPAFDMPAAYLAANLARKAAGIPRGEFPKQTVKTDLQIIAIAIHNRASKIITNERDHFVKLADGRIEISEVPNIHEQQPIRYDA